MERQCPDCGDVLPVGARACQCGWRQARPTRNTVVDVNCVWNDHGYRCGKRGSVSETTNGSGPWYCAEHYAKLKGHVERQPKREVGSYRERWYRERGLPFEAVKLGNCGAFQCVGGSAHKAARILREPGQDDEERDAA